MPEAASSTPLFAFRDVYVELGGRDVLRGVTAVVPQRGLTVIVGPSGSGKSTLLRLCNRLALPSSGRVELRGRDLADLDVLALRRRVGMVFQAPTLFAGTVRDNLRVAQPNGTEDALRTALARAELDPAFLDRDGDTLSGGEAQRACLARTLVTEPEVLLADEPTSALDEATARALERTARELVDGGVAVLWVTHDVAQARRIADRVIALDDGVVAATGDAADVLRQGADREG